MTVKSGDGRVWEMVCVCVWSPVEKLRIISFKTCGLLKAFEIFFSCLDR